MQIGIHLPQYGRVAVARGHHPRRPPRRGARLRRRVGQRPHRPAGGAGLPVARTCTTRWSRSRGRRRSPSEIGLGTSVLVVPQHNPLELANSLASLDDLSGGRLIVGVGVGWSAARVRRPRLGLRRPRRPHGRGPAGLAGGVGRRTRRRSTASTTIRGPAGAAASRRTASRSGSVARVPRPTGEPSSWATASTSSASRPEQAAERIAAVRRRPSRAPSSSSRSAPAGTPRAWSPTGSEPSSTPTPRPACPTSSPRPGGPRSTTGSGAWTCSPRSVV